MQRVGRCAVKTLRRNRSGALDSSYDAVGSSCGAVGSSYVRVCTVGGGWWHGVLTLAVAASVGVMSVVR